MRTNKDYILREIVGENVLIPTGKASAQVNGMIHMSDTGVFIWKLYDKSATLDEIVDAVCEEFEVDRQTAKKDTIDYTVMLVRAGMVMDVPDLEL